jgi:hypothetical protein
MSWTTQRQLNEWASIEAIRAISHQFAQRQTATRWLEWLHRKLSIKGRRIKMSKMAMVESFPSNLLKIRCDAWIIYSVSVYCERVDMGEHHQATRYRREWCVNKRHLDQGSLVEQTENLERQTRAEREPVYIRSVAQSGLDDMSCERIMSFLLPLCPSCSIIIQVDRDAPLHSSLEQTAVFLSSISKWHRSKWHGPRPGAGARD